MDGILMFMEHSRDPYGRNASYFWSNIRPDYQIVRNWTYAGFFEDDRMTGSNKDNVTIEKINLTSS